MPRNNAAKQQQVRYAVVGLGHIAQVAVLPAFAHAQNSVLTALVSNDPEKLEKLGRKYKVKARFSYDQYEECLESGVVDAVYIALPITCTGSTPSARPGQGCTCSARNRWQ